LSNCYLVNYIADPGDVTGALHVLILLVGTTASSSCLAAAKYRMVWHSAWVASKRVLLLNKIPNLYQQQHLFNATWVSE